MEILALLSDPAAWAALITLIALEVVLGIDNLVFIAILAEKLRAVVEGSPFVCDDVSFGLTISLGVHQYDHGESLDANIGRADAMLYQAKQEGRNRVVCRKA